MFARMSRFLPALPVMGTGKAKFQPVAVETVAEAFVRSLGEPRSVGQTYDLCGPDTLTLPEILDTILAVTGRKRAKLRIPIGVARFQATVLEFYCARLLGQPPPLNRDQLIMLEEGNVGNGQPANELFGLEAVGFREGISRYLLRKGE
jgi:NADH dehydrogenase